MTTNKSNGKQVDIATLSELKTSFEQLLKIKNSFDLECELIKIAKQHQLSLEECRILWEKFRRNQKKRQSFSDFPLFLKEAGGWISTLGQFSLLTGAILFIVEAGTREKNAIHESWRLINSVPKEVTASAGRIDAFESLNQGCIEENTQKWIIWRKWPLIQGFYRDCVFLTGLSIPNGTHLDGLNLPWAQLQQAQFKNISLQNANFAYSQLQTANFSSTELQNAIFTFTNLTATQLIGANLAHANLKEANLTDADLTYANLQEADLRGANLNNTTFYKADLKGAIYNKETKPFDLLNTYFKEQKAYLIDENTNLVKAYLENVDLSNANLSNANLVKANLRNANLYNANLKGAKLNRANLRGTNLTNAQITLENLEYAIYDLKTKLSISIPATANIYLLKEGAALSKANLEEADLQGANLKAAKLQWANLKGANLRGADLTDAILTGTIFRGAFYDVDTKLPKKYQNNKGNLNPNAPYFLDSGITLPPQTNLSKANLGEINLTNATLNEVNFRGANLRNAKLNVAQLINANLAEVNLSGANLKEAKLNNVILVNANLRSVKLNDAQLNGANLENVNLMKAFLKKAFLIGVNLKEANLKEADLEDANLNNANLKDADLESANLKGAIGLKPQQIKQAKNWQKAMYDPAFKRLLDRE